MRSYGCTGPRKIQRRSQIHSVIDLFSKLIHLFPVKTKSGPSVAWAFGSIYDEPKYSGRKRRSEWVRTDKGKELPNKHFQDMLRGEGLKFQLCKNPDLKYAVVEVRITRFAKN